MKRVWIALTAALIAAALLTATSAQGASLVADYRLSDSLASSIPGAPPLSVVGTGGISFADAMVGGGDDRVAVFPRAPGFGFKPPAGKVNSGNLHGDVHLRARCAARSISG